jgi:hypothetical protein
LQVAAAFAAENKIAFAETSAKENVRSQQILALAVDHRLDDVAWPALAMARASRAKTVIEMDEPEPKKGCCLFRTSLS